MVEVTQEDMHQAAIAHDYDDWPAFWFANGAWAQKQARHFARHRTTALAAKEAELAAERAKVEKLRDLVLRADEWRQPRKWHEDAAAALTETQPDETGRGVSGPPDRGEETANATATAPDLSGTQP